MESDVKRDWGLMAGGVALAIAGLAIMVWPGATLIAIALASGAVLAAAGIFDVAGYVRYRRTYKASAWALASGIGQIVVGYVFFAHPLITALVAPWVAGVLVGAYGILSIVSGIRLRRSGPGWTWMVGGGIVALLCAAAFLAIPASLSLALGAFLIMRGASMTYFSAVVTQKDGAGWTARTSW